MANNTVKTINSFNYENAFLSNMYSCKVEFEGLTYTCSEAAFQAAKCKNPADRIKFTELDGKTAKALGKKIELRASWNQIRYGVMYNVVYNKFMQNEALYKKLMATKGVTLVEGNTWGDKYWGVCNGEGENKLGKILMDIRDNNKKEAPKMKKQIWKKENKTMLKKPLIIAATNSAFRQDFGKNEIMKIAKACCPEDHMLYTFTGARENNKVVALSLINIFNNKVIPAHKDTWDPALYSEFIDNDGVEYPYGTMDAQTKMEYVYAYIKRTFGSLDALVFTTPYDDDRSLVNTFDKVSVFVRAEGFIYTPAVYQATGDPIIENGKQAVWYKYTENVEERYVKVSAKRYMQFDFEKLPFSLPARSFKPDYNASYINDSDNYWSDEYDCMIEKGNKYNDAYALQHAFRFKADADMTKDLENYELFKQVFDCHNYKVRRSLYDTYTMDPKVSKEDMAQEIEYMKAVQKFIAETGHSELFLKDRNCPECNKHFTGDVCPRCGHKYDESAPEREIAIGSIKIMGMIGRNDDGDIVVGTDAADESDWAFGERNLDITDAINLAEDEDC